jgi:hypothetical protein
MHTYVKTKSEEGLYTVGYWEPTTWDEGYSFSWRALEDFGDEEDARRMVNYLNGGSGELFPRK